MWRIPTQWEIPNISHAFDAHLCESQCFFFMWISCGFVSVWSAQQSLKFEGESEINWFFSSWKIEILNLQREKNDDFDYVGKIYGHLMLWSKEVESIMGKLFNWYSWILNLKLPLKVTFLIKIFPSINHRRPRSFDLN